MVRLPPIWLLFANKSSLQKSSVQRQALMDELGSLWVLCKLHWGVTRTGLSRCPSLKLVGKHSRISAENERNTQINGWIRTTEMVICYSFYSGWKWNPVKKPWRKQDTLSRGVKRCQECSVTSRRRRDAQISRHLLTPLLFPSRLIYCVSFPDT